MNMENTISVIVADDEIAIRKGLQNIIQIDGYQVIIKGSADNGKSALTMILEHHPDIVIIDINMPEMDGLEVIRQCMELKLKTRFFVLSGYDDFSYAQTAICYGVKYYFLKPLNIAEFKKQFIKQCEEVLLSKSVSLDSDKDTLDVVLSSSKVLFLNELISGQMYQFDSMVKKLSELYLTIKNTSNCSVIFEFDKDTMKKDHNLKDINNLVIKPLFSDYSMESWAYDDYRIVAIFNLDDNQSLQFRYKLNQCLKELLAVLSMDIKIGIGSVVSTLESTQLSFYKAKEAITYHIYMPDQHIFDNHMITEHVPNFSKENVDVLPLIEAIINNNNLAIHDYLNRFFESLFFTKTPQPNFLFGMCIYLIMEVHKHLNQRYPDLKLSMASTIEMINTFKSVSSLRTWMDQTMISFPNTILLHQKNNNQLIKKAKTFIDENLYKNIKAKDVASHVNLSTSYFTIYFKETTGINFREYLLNEKMKVAKKLLDKRKKNIGEIAELIGYQDYRSFSRAFKNSIGMSPSDYISKAQ